MTDDGSEAPGPASSGVTCVVLAAGSSTRMGGSNKLLERVDDVPMVLTVVETALASRADEVVVVTGKDRERVEQCLAGIQVRLVWNPDHVEGLSTSLRAGVSVLPSGARAVAVCLGDMPLVRPGHIDALIRAFLTDSERSIFVPTWQGKRGNPVLWTVNLLPEIGTLTGDVGVKALMSRHPAKVREVPVDEPGVLTDVDTPEALEELVAPHDTRP